MTVEFQSVVTAFVSAGTTMSVQIHPEDEYVVFRFGTGMRRLDLSVNYRDLDRVDDVVQHAKQQRDTALAAEQEQTVRERAERAGTVG